MQLGGADLRHQRRRGLEVSVQDVQRGRLVIGSSGLIELRRLGSGSKRRKIRGEKIWDHPNRPTGIPCNYAQAAYFGDKSDKCIVRVET